MCGSVRYRTKGAPLRQSICHCTFCQRRTGSAFAEVVHFNDENVEITGGPLTTHEHRSDETHRWLRMQFCPRCGTTVTWTAERVPGARGISGGTFDDPNWFKIQRHIWTRLAQRWVALPLDAELFQKGLPG